MISELRAALGRADWDAALHHALALWREHRTLALADLVDELSPRATPIAVPPPRQHHSWWVTHASYDPIAASTLLAQLWTRAQGSSISWATLLAHAGPLAPHLRDAGITSSTPRGQWLDLVARTAILLTWPDDPRVARALAAITRAPAMRTHEGYALTYPGDPHVAARPCRRAIAARVAAIGELSAIALVHDAVGPWEHTLRGPLQAASQRVPAPDRRLDAEVAACLRMLRPRSHDDALAALWAAVAARPRDLAARIVLADALTERGDPRGEVMALQCTPLLEIERARAAGEPVEVSSVLGRTAWRAHASIEAHWWRWMGDLALVIAPRRLDAGTLRDAPLGTPRTPAWAYDRIANHHELAAAAEMSAWLATPAQYARVLVAMVRPPRRVHLRGVDAAALLELGERTALYSVTCTLRGDSRITGAQLRALAPLLPALGRLELLEVGDERPDGLARLARELAAAYPALHTLRVTLGLPAADADLGAFAEVASLPYVTVVG